MPDTNTEITPDAPTTPIYDKETAFYDAVNLGLQRAVMSNKADPFEDRAQRYRGMQHLLLSMDCNAPDAAMLAVQKYAMHHATMECLRGADSKGYDSDTSIRLRTNAVALARAFNAIRRDLDQVRKSVVPEGKGA